MSDASQCWSGVKQVSNRLKKGKNEDENKEATKPPSGERGKHTNISKTHFFFSSKNSPFCWNLTTIKQNH